jgi:hypothetical protein
MKPPRRDGQNIADGDQVKRKSRESRVLKRSSVASEGVAEERETHPSSRGDWPG